MKNAHCGGIIVVRSHVRLLDYTYKNKTVRSPGLEQVSFECRKVIGIALTTPHDWFKKLRATFYPIRNKPKQIRIHSHVRVFPRFSSATCNY